jgi:hypothetical protein
MVEAVSKGRNPLTAKNAKNIAKNAKDRLYVN